MDDYYKTLNIPRTSSEDEIHKIVSQQMRLWTQRTNAPTIEKRQEAERMIKLITEAENTLLDSSLRADYDRRFEHTSSVPADSKDTAKALDENILVQKAKNLVRDGNYPPAISLLKKAIALDTGNMRIESILRDAKKEWGQILIKQNH